MIQNASCSMLWSQSWKRTNKFPVLNTSAAVGVASGNCIRNQCRRGALLDCQGWLSWKSKWNNILWYTMYQAVDCHHRVLWGWRAQWLISLSVKPCRNCRAHSRQTHHSSHSHVTMCIQALQCPTEARDAALTWKMSKPFGSKYLQALRRPASSSISWQRGHTKPLTFLRWL